MNARVSPIADAADTDADAPGYRLPPAEIAALVDAPTTPEIAVNGDGSWLLALSWPALLPLAQVARPEVGLAGVRIDPTTNGPSRGSIYDRLSLQRVADGSEHEIAGIPASATIHDARWAPDGRRFAFTVSDDAGIALWVGDVTSQRAQRVTKPRLNAVLGRPFTWLPDSRGLVCRMIPSDRGAPPEPPPVPTAPVMQEHSGEPAPAWTYQDLLASPHDEALFEHYATSQLVRVTLEAEPRATPIGEPGLIQRVEPSPSGTYLLIETVHRPFSYLVPYRRFPLRIAVWDAAGRVVREVADLPLAERMPTDRDAARPGPRAVEWRSDASATLAWAEAQDGGDPHVEATVRDRVVSLPEPFDGAPTMLAELALRYAGVRWGDGATALVVERWWKTRWTRTWRVAPDDANAWAKAQRVFDRSWEDRYNDPGEPMTRMNDAGQRVLERGADGAVYLAGPGGSPEGDRPFVDRFDLARGTSDRLWQSAPPHYETPVCWVDAAAGTLLTRREAADQPPNYFQRSVGSEDSEAQPVTRFPHPTPQLTGVHKELICYTRDDGVELSGTLYLPPDYRPNQGPLPTILWAYPREFKSAASAGQVKDSPCRFVRFDWKSPLFLVTQGYAILDGPTMPIIGEGDREANDTYIEQLTASARAAVDELVRRGVTDPRRVAVGGHSYGGFMTANLLAHSDLFRAGIARSGAYNRTLTPFGFQAEERTLWQAPDVYITMSPFMHADRIDAPLLLIHGAADNNPGTFPVQSERLYHALKGNAKTARLVMLPHESHAYRARESAMHTLWEMTDWLKRHVD